MAAFSCDELQRSAVETFPGYRSLAEAGRNRLVACRFLNLLNACASHRPLEAEGVPVAVPHVEERVDLCDSHSLFPLSRLHDFAAGANLAFLSHARVEPRPAARCQQCRHPGLVHPNANGLAGNARLRDLEQRAADLITVANAHGIVGQSFDGDWSPHKLIGKGSGA